MIQNMKNFILLLVVIMTTITISAQKVNRFGQKVVKEIHIAYVSKKGKILPQEEFFYDYDNELRLIGILRIIVLPNFRPAERGFKTKISRQCEPDSSLG